MAQDKTLFLVSLPIGNSEDITLRALEVLKAADYILCEDTRSTNNFLSKHKISQKLISYRDQNHFRVIDQIISDLNEGKTLCLVSDYGTPTISDPGFKLISEIRAKHPQIIVSSVPGPVAFISAVSISGLPTDNITFLGFLPKTKSKRKNLSIFTKV